MRGLTFCYPTPYNTSWGTCATLTSAATMLLLTKCMNCRHLEHLLDLVARQVDIELVQQMQNLADAQGAVAVLIRLRERLLQPRTRRHRRG